ncbi:MAG: CoA transferase [Deltaproteobacteria bacterium]|nr:CoA transferase [Deltaproteobacteria bacterium]MBW2052837.1 CoA transferase [Deltaproteobacteria bacterium]MBW2141485.1 CoA transferase [Deltaproteobacteria bacterium]MBW2322894.1 CoA transferase [Deltaproteobacteria bacterium]
MTERALAGIKVLEFGNLVSAPYCAKLIADLGAEVIKIEEPGHGDDARRRGPFPANEPHQEKSGLFLYLNTNKFGITLDPFSPEGKIIFEKLVKDADVLIEDRSPGEMEKMGLGYDDLKKLNPGLIMASITPFGQTGAYRNYKAYQLNIAHLSGQGYLLPIPTFDLDRPPVKAGCHSSDYDPGLVSVVAIMAALYWKGASGQGQFIDLSKQEALISMQRIESVTYANSGESMTRQGPQHSRMPGGIMPCKNGHVVVVTPEEHQWQALMTLIGNPKWSQGDMCKDQQARSENADELTELIIEWMIDHTKEEIFEKGQALSCPIAPVNSAEDIVNSKQMEARNFFVEMEHSEAGRIKKFPASPYRFSKTPWRLDRPAPLLGEHNKDIYCGRLGYTEDDLTRLEQDGAI